MATKVQISLIPGAHIHNKPSLPPCEAKVKAEYRGHNKLLGDKCGNFAKVSINEKNYCIRHAQGIALEILLRGEDKGS